MNQCFWIYGQKKETIRIVLVFPPLPLSVKRIQIYEASAESRRWMDGKGSITKVGEQVVLGANDTYIGLCRKHWRLGDPGPGLRAEDLKRNEKSEN